MGFLDKLKDMFIYTGDDYTKVSDKDNKDNTVVSTRLDVGNPLRRIKNIKDDLTGSIKSNSSIAKMTMSNHTKTLIYNSLHYKVEEIVQKGKPIEEARMLYRRFLEDHVTDEALYSDLDLEYIKALVRTIRYLKSYHISKSLVQDDVIKDIISSPRFLNIIELLEIQYGYKMMEYFCENSYIICGYRYNRVDNSFGNINAMKLPHFKLDINDSTYILLNEVKSLVSDDSSTESKEEYIISKVVPFFKRYVILNEVPTTTLMIALDIFGSREEETIVEDKSIIYDNIIVDTVEETITDEEIQKRMFEGISRESGPVEQLNKESKFINLYKPLSDPRNPDVSLEELKDAIKDIDSMMFIDDYDLSKEEFEIYNSIKSRLNILNSIMNGDEFDD